MGASNRTRPDGSLSRCTVVVWSNCLQNKLNLANGEVLKTVMFIHFAVFIHELFDVL